MHTFAIENKPIFVTALDKIFDSYAILHQVFNEIFFKPSKNNLSVRSRFDIHHKG